MNKTPLTPAQRKVLKKIKEVDKPIVRTHRKSTGTVVYRLLDEKINPIMNIRRSVLDRLINKGRISINGGGYCELK